MRTRLFSLLVVGPVFACAACDEKPKTDGALVANATTPANAASDVSPPVPIVASAAVTAADGSTKRTYSGDHFEVILSAPACKAKTECNAQILISAKPGYHINDEYPYRFAAKSGGGVAFKGKATPEVFSKGDGDFSKASASEGSIQVRYEADGSAKKIPLSGLLKMSVCSESACQIETPSVELDVPLAS